MADKAKQIADGFSTLQNLVKSSKPAEKSSKSDDSSVKGLYSALKNQNPGSDPVENGRNDMLDWRQRKADSGFSQDTNLPAKK